MSFKISFDIKCVAKNKIIYKATVSYFLIKKDNSIDKKSNYLCIKHEIKFHEIRLIPRKAEDNSEITGCLKDIEKAPKELQIRKLLLKDDEVLNINKSNKDLEIVLSNSVNTNYLYDFNVAFNDTNKTINNAYKYITGVNPRGHKTQEQFSSNVLIDINDKENKDYIFNNCSFIQFFTYILGDNNKQKSFLNFDKEVFEEISLSSFLNNHLDNFFYEIFLLSNIKHKDTNNKRTIDDKLQNIFLDLNNKNHYFLEENYEKIVEDFDWSKWELKNFKESLINKLIDLNQRINNRKRKNIIDKEKEIEDDFLREKLLEELEITSRRDITNKIANEKSILKDYLYSTFRKELICVENCHIFNIKDAKKYFKSDCNVSNWEFYLNSMSDISNILLLTSNIHSLFDANILKINLMNNLIVFNLLKIII